MKDLDSLYKKDVLETVRDQFKKTKKSPIYEELAHILYGQDVTRGYIDLLEPLIPQDSILTDLHLGYEDYRKLLTDSRIHTGVQQRVQAMLACEWFVDPGAKRGMNPTKADKKAADSIRYQINNLSSYTPNEQYATVNNSRGFDAVCAAAWFGRFYGLSVAEALYGKDSREIYVDQIAVRDRQRFVVDGLLRLRLLTDTAPLGSFLPPRKFWCFISGGDHMDDPYGLGLAHHLYWLNQFKKGNLEHWLRAIDKFSSPTVVGEYPSSWDAKKGDPIYDAHIEGLKANLLKNVTQLKSRSGLLVPQGVVLKMLEADLSRSGHVGQEAFNDRMDAEITRVLVGQTSTTEAVPGALGGNSEQQRVKIEYTKSDCDLIHNSLSSSLFAWLTQWNFPNAATPRIWRQVEGSEDLNARAERDTKIFSFSGLKPTKDYVVQVYGDAYNLVAEKEIPKPLQETNSSDALVKGEDESDVSEKAEDEDGQQFSEFASADSYDIDSLIDALTLSTARDIDTFLTRVDSAVVQRAGSFQDVDRLISNAFEGFSLDIDQLEDGVALAELLGRDDLANGR